MQQIQDRITKRHGDTVQIIESSYVTLRTPCRFIDKDYGEWTTDPWSVLSGGRHPKRGRDSMAMKQTITREEMIERLFQACGDTVTLGVDYVGVSTRCTFIDKDYGPWIQLPQRILGGIVHPKRRAEKARKTCLQRYGVNHTNHLPDVMEKITRTHPRWVKRAHWKTGKQLTCMSSYEVGFVEWCAHNRIDFEWQIKHVMPDGRAYIVDAHILDGEFANTWVEIKGWMRPEGQRKWEWFHALHANSQLWTREILHLHGIITTPVSSSSLPEAAAFPS